MSKSIGELVIWEQNLGAHIGANVALLAPLTPAIASALATAYSSMVTAVNNNTAAQAAAEAANAAQAQAIANFETQTRSVAEQMQASPTVTNQQREAAGLPVYDTIRTAVAPRRRVPSLRSISPTVSAISSNFATSSPPTAVQSPPGSAKPRSGTKSRDTQPVSENDYDYLAGDPQHRMSRRSTDRKQAKPCGTCCDGKAPAAKPAHGAFRFQQKSRPKTP